MSLKLLKQSVDIVEEDLKQSKSNKDKQTSNANKTKRKHLSNSTEVKHLSMKSKKNIQDVKKELTTENKESVTRKKRAMDLYLKKTEENIKRLLALSMNTINIKEAEKIVQRAHKGRYIEKIVPKVQQESIFSEEDFRKFEEEYFNS